MLDGPHKAKIIACKHDQDGNLIGRCNPNPMVNTRVYIAEFQDGSANKHLL